MTSLSTIDPLLTRARELLLKQLPPGPTLWLKPPGDTPLNHPDSRYYHPWYPEHQRLLAGGWHPVEEQRRWPQVVLFGGRQKEENKRLLQAAQSFAGSEGKVYFIVPNDYGAKSLRKDLTDSGFLRAESVGRKSRLFMLSGDPGESTDLESLEVNSVGLQSTPGLFSWDKADRGSQILAQVLENERLRGPVADLGAGWGYLSWRLPKTLELHLIEADRRGLKAAQGNLQDRVAHFHWADASQPSSLPQALMGRVSTVITNPPFHTNKRAEPVLGGAFVAMAAGLLNARGSFYMVGNSHLPYGKIVAAYFPKVEELARSDGFSVFRGSR